MVKGYHAALSGLASSNEYFRRVLCTVGGGQLVLMCLDPGEDTAASEYLGVDLFVWIVGGAARAEVDGEVAMVTDGEVLVIPRGTKHRITNASQSHSLKLFAVYTPPMYPGGTIHLTRADAVAPEERE